MAHGGFKLSKGQIMGYAESQLSRYLAMAEVRVKRSLEKDTLEKAKSGKCLVCGYPADGARGLCKADYLRFAREKAALPKSHRRIFDDAQVREGLVLASGQIHEIKNPSPFVNVASA
jgi:hypothetical protein